MKNNQGFTFVELIIVVVILGILAAVALPRYLDVVDDAEKASTEGVGGGFAAAVGIVRAQWEVDGRPADTIVLDGALVDVNRFGYPSGNGISVQDMTAGNCAIAFNSILQSPPSQALADADLSDVRYAVGVANGSGGSVIVSPSETLSDVDLCLYHLVSTLNLDPSTGLVSGTPAISDGKGFTYNPATGQVVSFSN